jgi:hypothetical protein
MIVKALAAGYCLWLGVALFAESALAGESFEGRWKTLRQHQPLGLTLEWKPPQTTFAQGEIISATLRFANASTNRYCVWAGTYDRSGRIPDIAFTAESETGQPVADPLAGYYASFGGMGGGLGNYQDLGVWSITLPANQWLRFDAPGTYRVYARSSRPRAGPEDAAGSARGIELVSDIVTIRVTPLEPEREQQILADAKVGLSQGGDERKRAIETLRYLQTPAARRALLPLLSEESNMEVDFGLIGAPYPKAEAPAVLQAAAQPDFAVRPDVIWLYGVLRTLGNPRPNDPKSDSAQFREANAQARSDIIAAVRSALAVKRGETLVTTLLTLLSDSPRDAELRAPLVAHQQDLSRPQLAQIISQWEKLGGDDFLPIIRTAARPPRADPHALGLLAKVAPDEARPLILEDLARAKPLYINPGEGSYAVEPLEALPDRELPQLDEVLRRKLRDKNPDLFVVMPLIARYATTNLLADVLAVYKTAEGRWACDIQNSALRYWIRCNPMEGVQALAAALKARQQTGCYQSTLSQVLLEHWVDEALPVVLAALQDENTDVVESAVRVLERNASAEVVPQVIVAIQRSSRMTGGGERQQAWRVESMAMLLLESKRWKLTRSQLEQLAESLPAGQARDTIRRQLN